MRLLQPVRPDQATPRINRILLAPLRRIVDLVKKSLRSDVHAYWRSRPVRKRVVLYESFGGSGMLCNPEAIFRALHQNPEFQGFTHIWALSNTVASNAVVAEFAGDRSVRFVTINSYAYLRALATSGYLINNATFATEFGKRDEQVYLNTWHGTPLKKMGFDIGDPANRVANVVRNFLSADYLLAPNQFTVEALYESAHRLGEIYPGKVIVEGYPRIDHQFADAATLARTRRILLGDASERSELDDRKIILYAPTWKGTSFQDPEDDIAELVRRIDELEAGIDPQRFVVRLKTHQVVHSFASGVAGLSHRLVSNDIPANVVLAATDILITDYSSIFFDFLISGRPILFLAPDRADYAGYRGLYTEPELWPGPVVDTMVEIAEQLRILEQGKQNEQVSQNYSAMREMLSSHDDGQATARVIDIVFRGNGAEHNVIQTRRSRRPRILLNAGSMRPNGITRALLNLLNALDYDKFDVSVVFPYTRNPVVIDRQRQIHPAVRQFVRVGTMNGSRVDHAVRLASWRRGDLRNHSTDTRQKKLWDAEWKRCFGLAEFDFVVDFSGYSPLWATLMLHAPKASTAIWLHNEMAVDGARVGEDQRNPLSGLEGIFSLYREYDHLVSVSPTLSTINSRTLAEYASPSQFRSATNIVDAHRVRELGEVPLNDAVALSETGETPSWAQSLGHPGGAAFTFVTAGRLSADKNLPRLVRAFALVHADSRELRLVIIGEGPQREMLEALVDSLGISASVVFTGNLANPYAVMRHCDCFVSSNDWDGSPAVISEARILGLPVVAVDFGTACDIVPPSAGLRVPQTDSDLAAAMANIVKNGFSAEQFDPEQQNDQAVLDFAAAIGIPNG